MYIPQQLTIWIHYHSFLLSALVFEASPIVLFLQNELQVSSTRSFCFLLSFCWVLTATPWQQRMTHQVRCEIFLPFASLKKRVLINTFAFFWLDLAKIIHMQLDIQVIWELFLRKNLSNKGREFIVSKKSWQHFIREIFDIFDDDAGSCCVPRNNGWKLILLNKV